MYLLKFNRVLNLPIPALEKLIFNSLTILQSTVGILFIFSEI